MVEHRIGDRRDSVRAWLVPALLGLIGVLILLGGGNVLNALQDQVNETRALHSELTGLKSSVEDLKKWEDHIETRMNIIEQRQDERLKRESKYQMALKP